MSEHLTSVGLLPCRNAQSAYEVCRKVSNVCRLVGFSEVDSARTAATISGLVRNLYATHTEFEIGVYLNGDQVVEDLVFSFPSDVQTIKALEQNDYFEVHKGTGPDGQKLVLGFRNLRNRGVDISPLLIRDTRECVSTLSRDELMAELKTANEELEAHRIGLERTVEERTASLSEKEAQLRMAMDNMPGAMWVVDNDLRIVLSNNQYASFYGDAMDMMKPGESMVEKIYMEAQSGLLSGSSTEVEELVSERIESYRSNDMSVFEDRTPDGRHVHLVRKPVQSGHVISVATDITERKIAEQELENTFQIISSSINYASRIQRSVLPDTNLLSKTFREHFVLWEPRDVVGGDIYWASHWGEGVVVILGDCTGHGVPGAFMTLITTGAMERALIETEPGELGRFLQRIHQQVQVTLGQGNQESESDDGMELGICFLQPDSQTMSFAGARFDLFVCRDGFVDIVKSTRRGIGYRNIPFDQVYEEHTVDLYGRCSFYMTTDGLIDQVGGERGRMYGKKRFSNLLLEIQDREMSHQR